MRFNMYSTIGSCPKCGAPIYTYGVWNGVQPPPPLYSCNCRNTNNKSGDYVVYTNKNNVIDNNPATGNHIIDYVPNNKHINYLPENAIKNTAISLINDIENMIVSLKIQLKLLEEKLELLKNEKIKEDE